MGAAWRHKILSIIALFIIGGGGYYGYGRLFAGNPPARYITTAATKGMLVTSISGTGQISASNQTDLKAQSSGDILAVYVKSGDAVTTSTLIAKIDDSDARKAVRDAQNAVDTARNDLNDTLAPPAEIDVLKAQNALDTAKSDLEDLLNPAGSDGLQAAQDSLTSAQDSLTKLKTSQANAYQNALDTKQKDEDDLVQDREDAFNTISGAFLDLPDVMNGVHDIIYTSDISDSEPTIIEQPNTEALISSIENYDQNDTADLIKMKKFVADAENAYVRAKNDYDANLTDYKDTSRDSDSQAIENLLAETADTVRDISDAVKDEANMLDFWADFRTQNNLTIWSKVASYQSDVRTYTSKVNSLLSSLISAQNSIANDKQSITDAANNIAELEQSQPLDLAASVRNVKDKQDALDELLHPNQSDIDLAQLTVKEKQSDLDDLMDGADPTTINSKRLALQQKQDTLADAQDALAACNVYPPYDGTMASVDVAAGDSVNSGTVIGSLITPQKIAEISLNEIDAANVKNGQRATLVFDALPDLSVTGKVAEIDTVGTVSQGVVSYNVKIALDVDETRIKPGMTTSVTIITASKADALLVPLGAVKTAGGGGTVQVLADGQPQTKTVTTGTSNDTMIEITSGLSEGDEVITQTIDSGSTVQAGTSGQSSQSTQRGGSTFFMSGGAMRALRGN